MPITLKHINISDSDSIKLDKVNYNFDQLVANGGGPTGPQGSIGQDGPQGTTGQRGFQGVIGNEGFQGAEGPISENYWEQIDPDAYIDADRLVPVYTSGDQFAPVVNIGYLENDPQYGNKLPLISGKTPYQWNIHRRQYSPSNLRFENNSILGNGFDFKLEKLTGKDQMTFGFINYSNSISNYKAAITRFQSSTTSTPSFIIGDFEARFKTNTVFNSPVVIKEQLIIENANADEDKIAISEDNTGLVKFKSVQELGGTVPFGTIVSILPSIFADNTKFINSEQVTPENDSPVEISVGKGIGNYTGWYLCHGLKWIKGVDEYQVPKLGNFNYSIDDNPFSTSPNSQGTAPATPLTPITHITGGSDIDMTATSVPTLVYNITSTVSTSTVNVDPGTGTTFKIKQLPQIIYLGRNDLYWQDPGTGQAPSIPLTIQLDDTNTTASKLSPDPYTIANITNQPAGASYSFVSLPVQAPLGYYWSTIPTPAAITGHPFITIQSITAGPGTFPTTIQIGFDVNPHPNAAAVESLGIDTSTFISAASAPMQLNRSNPSNATVNLGTSIPITYNFATGYSFTLIVTANSGYAFNGLTPTTITSISGGGTYTVTSSTLSSGINGANTVLTLNITLTGVPFGTTSLLYGLNLPIFSSVPRITSGNPYKIIGTGMFPSSSETGNSGAATSIPVTVTNNTGATVYIWSGINNFSTGGAAPNVTVPGGYQKFTSPTFNLSFTGAPNAITYSGTYHTLPNGQSVTANLYRALTTDAYHVIELYWANSFSAPASSRQPIGI